MDIKESIICLSPSKHETSARHTDDVYIALVGPGSYLQSAQRAIQVWYLPSSWM